MGPDSLNPGFESQQKFMRIDAVRLFEPMKYIHRQDLIKINVQPHYYVDT